jgi:hypothetical protein
MLLTLLSRVQVRSAGVFASLFMSSLLLRENVLALIMAQVLLHLCAERFSEDLTPASQVYALLDQLAASVGLSMPEYHWVYALAVVLARGFAARGCMRTNTDFWPSAGGCELAMLRHPAPYTLRALAWEDEGYSARIRRCADGHQPSAVCRSIVTAGDV